jgi:hypothetical protein
MTITKTSHVSLSFGLIKSKNLSCNVHIMQVKTNTLALVEDRPRLKVNLGFQTLIQV